MVSVLGSSVHAWCKGYYLHWDGSVWKVQICFFVGMHSIYRCTAVDDSTFLLSIMAMASHGRQVFHFLRVVCVEKGFEDEFSDNSDLLKMVRRVFLARNNPTYGNLL
jgi:hypothetical protein